MSTGLGFPWLVASIYWEYYDPVQGFEVGSRAIIFQVSLPLCLFKHDQCTYFPCCQVVIYAISAFLGLGLICLRRNLAFFGRAELGGPTGPKYFSAVILFSLWLAFIIINILRAYDYINVDGIFESYWSPTECADCDVICDKLNYYRTLHNFLNMNKDILWCFCIDFIQNDCSNWPTLNNISKRWLMAGLFSHVYLKIFRAFPWLELLDARPNKAVKYWKLTVNPEIFRQCTMYPASIGPMFQIELSTLLQDI